MKLGEVVNRHGNILNIRFDLSKFTFFVKQTGSDKDPLAFHDIEKGLKIKDLKKMIEGGLDGPEKNLSELVEKF